MKHILMISAVIVCLTGCAGIAAKKPGADAEARIKRFGERLPGHLVLLNSLIFKYGFKSPFTALGMIEMDAASGEFNVVCISPLGMKLFEISADRDSTRSSFVIKELAGKASDERFAHVVGEDIRRVYFNLMPSALADARERNGEVTYRETHGGETIMHVFSSLDGTLKEKRSWSRGEISWKVSYHDYREEGGMLIPGKAVMRNFRHGYSLTVILNKVYGNEQD